MIEIKLYKTTAKGLKIIGMSIPFVLIGIWMITEYSFGTSSYIMGWVSTCFFGLGIPIGLFQTLDKRPQIKINENGIWDRTTNQDEIKWEQIIDAYLINIHGQKFISIVADKSFIFKKKQYKWAVKMSKTMGFQQLNLQLGQINIDVNKLTKLINKLRNSKRENRKKIIQSFKIDKSNFSITDILKIFLYIFISIGLLLISLSGLNGFMAIMIIMGIAVFPARYYSESNTNTKIQKYSAIIIWLGFMNMVLCLLTIKSYDYITNNTGQKISNQVDNYKFQHSIYPDNLDSVFENIDLSLFDKYFVNKIEYSSTVNDYEMKLINPFNNKQKIYNIDLQEWE